LTLRKRKITANRNFFTPILSEADFPLQNGPGGDTFRQPKAQQAVN
jgi:hypothetical protein